MSTVYNLWLIPCCPCQHDQLLLSLMTYAKTYHQQV